MVDATLLRSLYPGSLANIGDAQIQAMIMVAESELDPITLGDLYDRILTELTMFYLTTMGAGLSGAAKSESVSGSVGGGSTSRSVSVGSQDDNFHWKNYRRLLQKAVGITARLSF